MRTKEQIIAGMVVNLPPGGNSIVRTYRYTDPDTGRMFGVRRSISEQGNQHYFLEEYVPNGRIGEFDKNGHCVAAHDEPIIKETERRVGPNQLMAELAALGFTNFDQLIFDGGGFGVGTKFFASMDECAEQIAEALAKNTRYIHVRPLSPAEAEESEARRLQEKRGYWEADLSAGEAAESESGIFKGCRSMAGPLSEDAKQSILGYLNAPTQEKWNDIRGLYVAGPVTCWQAWIATDKQAPRLGSKPGFPSPEVLRHSIRTAVEERADRARRELAECQAAESVEETPSPSPPFGAA